MRVLADADIFIEIYFNRSEFKKHLQNLCEIIKVKQIDVCVTDKYLKRIHLELFSEQFYRGSVLENIKQAVDDDYITHRLITVTEEIRNQAYKLGLRDSDSAEELICAKEQNVDAIITLNPQNFGGTNFQIINIQDLTDASEDLEGNNSQSIPVHQANS
jgi:predicted nucleic acid-binding protein